MTDRDWSSGLGQLSRLGRSLSAKLRNEAKSRGTAADYLRKQYVFTLLFNRLFSGESTGWMLLGGNALLIRTGGGRFTQDIDLARDEAWDDSGEVLNELQSIIASTSTADPFRFDLHKIIPNREADEFGYGTTTATISVTIYLGTQIFEQFNIDVTSRRHVDGPVDHVLLLPVIEHETLKDLPEVPVVPIENHLADKLCAMYEDYGNGPSTRYRDLADVVRIVQQLSFNASRLIEVIAHEAQRRKMEMPTRLTAPGGEWMSAYPKAAESFAEFPKELRPLDASLRAAASCLDGPLSGAVAHGDWDPNRQSWIR